MKMVMHYIVSDITDSRVDDNDEDDTQAYCNGDNDDDFVDDGNETFEVINNSEVSIS